MRRAGSRLDIQRISQGLGIDRRTVIEYLDFLEHTYFISLLKPLSHSTDAAIRKSPKVYFCDSGMVNAIAKVDRGVLFEQIIFQTLRQRGSLSYYQKKTGLEIDFILNPVRDSKSWKGAKTEHISNGVNKKQALEVKTTVIQPDINKLKRLAQELKLADYKVVILQKTGLKRTLYGFQL